MTLKNPPEQTSNQTALLDVPFKAVRKLEYTPIGNALIGYTGNLSFTTTGIIPPAIKPSIKEMAAGLEVAVALNSGSKWCAADIAAMALEIDGAEAILEQYFRPGYIANMRYVSRAWPIELRRDFVGNYQVPYSWHQLLAPIMVKARKFRQEGKIQYAEWSEFIAMQWIDDAVEHNFTWTEFKQQVRSYLLPPSLREYEPGAVVLTSEEPLDFSKINLNLPKADGILFLHDIRAMVIELIKWSRTYESPLPDRWITTMRSLLSISDDDIME